MNRKQVTVQLGKQGLTDNFMQTLENALSTHDSVRISALPSSGRTRETIGKIADEIVSKIRIKKKYAYRILGFTIILKKQ